MLSYKTPEQIKRDNAEAARIMRERGTGTDQKLSPQQAKDFSAALAKRKVG